ncbi:efflux RND transporter periplasmic adaptor subunit, partial [Pseudomonas sp. FW305-130]
SQALGLRTVLVRRGALASSVTATGTIDFNQRDIAVVQARTGGFVQRVYARAPGDIIGAGAPLADLLVPEWGGAQAEFLAVRRTGNAALTQA